ncbi:MAG: glycoside hydrolase family 3 protein [Gammaproteobacteria bacterium]|nr:glycoside hydrolase family 3 protein [Gammaproteobacteria bacterium]
MRDARQEAVVDAWLARLSLRQKIGQMTMAERGSVTPEDVKRNALGAVLSGGGSHPGGNAPADWVRMNDAFWQAAVGDEDSLGIPILFGCDAVHGNNNVAGATILPHNIGLGAAGNVELVAEAAGVTAREMLASGLDWNFAPVLAVVQDCRWGRTYESYGNDPRRAGRFGRRYVEALQGEDIVACVKHWVGDGGTGHGIDQGETTLSWEELEATHVAPYYPAFEAGVMTVMVSFNSWNGEKCHGSRFLVTDVLKGRLGFKGLVVSDWDGIDFLHEEYATAVRLSVNAGLDMFMVPERWREFIDTLEAEVHGGGVSPARIDDAVRRILRTKLRSGVFDRPRPARRPGVEVACTGCDAHREVARRAVRRSLVLLKNAGNLLPLDPASRILVAGKSAHDLGHQCGGWTLSWQGEKGNDTIAGTTVWQGIHALAPHARLSEDGGDADPDRDDVAVVVVGETAYAEGFGDIRSGDEMLVEAGSAVDGLMNPLEPYARSQVLAEVHPEDVACIRRIAARGVPVVAVLISGRPLVVEEEMAASTAFVAAWLPGSEGLGVGEVLLGREDFAGRLPLPWPSAAGNVPRFPAGFGLDYGFDNAVAMAYKRK